MARLFKLTIELYPPAGERDQYCIETFEQVRLANRQRILHFGIKDPFDSDDLEWLKDVIGSQLEGLIIRTAGVTSQLEF